MLEKTDKDNFIPRFADALSHAFDDRSWERIPNGSWLRYREIDGIRIGVVVSIFQPQFSSYPVNCDDMARLRNGKVDLIVIVFFKPSDGGRHKHVCNKEAGTFYDQTLAHKTTITGRFGEFWSPRSSRSTASSHPCEPSLRR